MNRRTHPAPGSSDAPVPLPARCPPLRLTPEQAARFLADIEAEAARRVTERLSVTSPTVEEMRAIFFPESGYLP